MRFCLNSRCNAKYLKQADEIKISWRDIESTPDVIEKYPDKTYIIEVPFFNNAGDRIDVDSYWKKFNIWNKLAEKKLVLCFSSVDHIIKAKENGLNWYVGFEVTSYAEYNRLLGNGVCNIRVGAPLFFDVDFIENYEHNRVVANVAHTFPPELSLKGQDGVNGIWIRPEDLDLYEGKIETIEFENVPPSTEEALFRIYAIEKTWPGEMYLICKNIAQYDTVNRMLRRSLSEARLRCRQKCERNGACSLCYRAFNLAVPNSIKNYKIKLEENKDG